jgi:hypothetical protein
MVELNNKPAIAGFAKGNLLCERLFRKLPWGRKDSYSISR